VRITGNAPQSRGAAERRPTTERVAIAVREQTRGLRIAVAGAVIVLGSVAAAGLWMSHREATARDAEVDRLATAYEEASRHLKARLQGTNDSALINELKERNDSLLRVVRAARGGQATAVAQQALQRNNDVSLALDQIDLPALRQANDSAVVLIGSEVRGQRFEATGFNVRRSGLIVTNRHVVSEGAGRPTGGRLQVKFADTPRWRHAHVVTLDDDPTIDLALVQVDEPGPFPVVRGIAASVDVPVGAGIATLGFPLGTDVPMEGAGTDAVAKTSLSAGRVSKTVSDVLQIDSFASHGSSGSPVLDTHGHVIGVVYGGMPGSGGRIVYAVPADRIAELVKTAK
jgi:S1-C subfamily serine protease